MSTTLIYNDHSITFHLKDKLMVNATDMAKIYNRRPNDFLCLQSTKRFIDAAYPNGTVTSENGNAIKPVVTINGGNLNHIKQGTWFHEDLALKFAAWLNPHFEVWMIRHIKELLQNGQTQIGSLPEDQMILQSISILQKRVEISKRKLIEAQQIIKYQEPKVLFAECVQSTEDSILIGTLAKMIAKKGVSIGEKRLYKWLREKGYLHQYGERRNLPTQRSIELGVLETIERSFGNPEHQRVSFTTKVTGKGQIYFINKFIKPAS